MITHRPLDSAAETAALITLIAVRAQEPDLPGWGPHVFVFPPIPAPFSLQQAIAWLVQRPKPAYGVIASRAGAPALCLWSEKELNALGDLATAYFREYREDARQILESLERRGWLETPVGVVGRDERIVVQRRDLEEWFATYACHEGLAVLEPTEESNSWGAGAVLRFGSSRGDWLVGFGNAER